MREECHNNVNDNAALSAHADRTESGSSDEAVARQGWQADKWLEESRSR